jgi:hypothetical protein
MAEPFGSAIFMMEPKINRYNGIPALMIGEGREKGKCFILFSHGATVIKRE